MNNIIGAGERDWYGIDWLILRNNLVKVCVRKSEKPFRELSGSSDILDNIVASYVNDLLEDIEKRALLDRVGLWAHAMPLFSNRSHLESTLKKEMSAVLRATAKKRDTVSVQQIIGQTMKHYFESARREILAADCDVSPNRIKTWERLDSISRKLAQAKPVESRCTDEHFEQLSNVVKTQHPKDKNLPRTVKTIMVYFYQFSGECSKFVEASDSHLETTSLEDAREMLAGVGLDILSGCLDQLSTEHLEIVDVAFGLGIGTVQYRSVDDFLHNRSIKLSEFEKLLKMVLEKLGNCLETSVDTTGRGYLL